MLAAAHSSDVKPNTLKLNDYLFVVLLIIPWNIYKGSTKVTTDDSVEKVDVTVFQFWFGRIISISADNKTEWKWEFLGSGGGP
ncbi:MAG: hypothetical protein ACXAC2_18475, partial [Candidatus Kariarchaeaceae archaeon]